MAITASDTPISEIMVRHVVTVPLHLPMEDLATLLLRLGISGAPVVDADGQLLGMVSKTDLVWEHHAHPAERARTAVAASSRGADAAVEVEVEVENRPRRATVRDLMSTRVLALQQTASIAHASALMAHEGIHRLPVITAAGRVVGQVSSLDILRWLGRAEGFVLPSSEPAGA